jgi:hypothetical protein
MLGEGMANLRARRRLTALLLALALSSAARGWERTDTLLMKSGDRVTCEIVSLAGGYLTARTLDFGTVSIEWTDVAGLISTHIFEVERADGVRFTGHFDSQAPSVLAMRTMVEEGWISIPFDQVISIRQVGTSIWSSRRGHINLGLDFAHADQDTDFSLDAELTFQGRRFTWKNTATSSISDDGSSDRRERDNVVGQLEIPAGVRFAWMGRGSYERNDDLGLEQRLSAAVAALWLPLRGAHGRMGLGLGVAEADESYTGIPHSTVTSGMVILAGEYHRFGSYGTTFGMEIVYLPTFSENRYRIEMRASLSQKIAGDLNIAISPYYSSDSHPPSPAVADEDWGWISSIGWRF